MDAFKAFKYFMAVKLHFTSEKYDVFESNGRVNYPIQAFEKRNDKKLFEKLSRKFSNDKDLIQFLVANFAYGNKNVVYSDCSDECYTTWIKRKESRTQVFANDVRTIIDHLEFNKIDPSMLYSIETGMPELLNLYLGGRVTLETMVILQDFDDYLRTWEPMIMLWHDHFLLIKKVKRFVKYDSNRVYYYYQELQETKERNRYGT